MATYQHVLPGMQAEAAKTFAVLLERLFGFQRGAAASGGPPELGEGAPGLWCEPTSAKHLRPCPP